MKTPTLAAVLFALSAGAALASPVLDANGDGKISAAEFRTGRTAMIMGADNDKDGRVSQAEFTAVAKIALDKAGRGGFSGGNRVFHVLDANDDGFIDRAEAEVAVDRRFKKLDGDDDGVLSELEQTAWKRPGATE